MNGVRLEPWHEEDLPLLTRLLGEVEMTRFLGGPESSALLATRHARYLHLNSEGRACMSRIVDGATGDAIGSIGYWVTNDEYEPMWEIGWAVDIAWQGRGIATAAIRLAQDDAGQDPRIDALHAYPHIGNVGSNAICRKTGFVLIGERDFEYPVGHPMRVNHWMWTVHRS